MAVQSGVGNLLQDAVNQVITKLNFLIGTLLHGRHGALGGLAQSYDTRYVLGTCTTLALLRAAVYEGTNFHTFPDIQKADALGAVQLVAAGAEHIDMVLVYIDRHLTEGLYRVGMEQNAVLMGDFTYLFDRLNGSNLIICKHHGNQDGFRTDGFLEFLDLDHTIFIYGQVRNLIAMLLQPLTGVQNRMMLDLCGNNVFSFALICLCSRFQRPVVGLASACGEINLLSLRAQRIRDGLSCFCDGLFALAAIAIFILRF